VTGTNLPPTLADFENLKRTLFPSFIDMKFLARRTFQGSLEHLAAKYKVRRVGLAHQAGSDAIMTGELFFKMVNDVHRFRDGNPWDGNGVLYGLHETGSPRAAAYLTHGCFVPPKERSRRENVYSVLGA